MLLKFLFFYFILPCISSRENAPKKEKMDDFQPTHEWKEIKVGQKVPAGLHYRINLSTGKKEAKIIEDDNQNLKNAFVLVNQNVDIKSSENQETIEILENDAQKIRTRYRSIEQLKRDLKDINLNPKTDTELMSELFSELEVLNTKEHNKKRILSALDDLIYLSHQIDNANEFVRLNGFQKIVYQYLNLTDDQILQDTLKLFSSLVQNNSKVKIHALESGAISKLLKILNLNSSPEVKYSAIIALSCLLRTFPFAQNSFIELGGVNVFAELLSLDNIKNKLKIVTLIDDLLMERISDPQNFGGHKIVNLNNILQKLNWCNHLTNLLNAVSKIDIDDHDSIEKCLTAMNSLKETCGEVYTKDMLKNLFNRYVILSNHTTNEDIKSYYKDLSDLSLSLASYTKSKDNLKTEL